jgi:hypothetical protein
MKSVCKSFGLLCVLCASVVNCFSLDREAFSVTNYDLTVQVDPAQHRMGVRGKVRLRNDSPAPQKIAVLQISSSLEWRSISLTGSVTGNAGSQAVQFVLQSYTSDIDHTGSLSEAIVTLPQPVAPKGTIEMEVAYEGVILIDATRFTRIGAPAEAAESADWDQIGPDFTAVRGAGYVAWYPIATEVANLSEGDSLFEVLSRWKAREAGATMRVRIGADSTGESLPMTMLMNEASCKSADAATENARHVSSDCTYQPLGLRAPAFVIASYQAVQRPTIQVFYLGGHDLAAANYADAAEKVVPLITEWFGKPRETARTADLPDANAAPFESGALLLTPLASADSKLAGLAAAHQLTHAAFSSPRPWIEEGLAHFAQALYLEQQKGRQSALDYMGLHRSAFSEAEEKTSLPRSEDEVNRALVNTTSEEIYRSKAMYVWWMLRDMVGDAALKKALAGYRAEDDKDPSYMPHLIAAQTQRDLQWFFEDWVYHDRGLPDVKVVSAFSSKTTANTFLLTVTVENLGAAGAEVPVVIKYPPGEIIRRMEVRGKSKATVRIEIPAAPQEIVANDGSVPESNLTNNVYKIDPAGK